MADKFTYSVYDRFELQNTNNTMVIGRVSGTIKKGCEVYIQNPGDDVKKIIITQVLGIEVGDGKGNYSQLDEISEGMAGIMLKDVAKENIKTGSVLYSKDASEADIHTAYVTAIGDAYIQKEDMNLTDAMIKKMSITDLAECVRLYNFVLSKDQKLTKDKAEAAYEKMNVVKKAMVNKLMALDHMYVVYNKETNEPHMFSVTAKKGNGYECTPPSILVITDAYYNDYNEKFKETGFWIHKINNGANKKGIFDFLAMAFYMNGAQGLGFCFNDVVMSAEKIIPKPSYEGLRDIDIPVTNPDLMRWMLLLSQIGEAKTKEEEVIYKLYFRFMALEMKKAKFVIPMQIDESKAKGDNKNENGTYKFNKDTQIKLAVNAGKTDRPALHMYTDWKMLRQMYGEEWNGMVQTIDDMIGTYDIILNANKFPANSIYIDQDMYNNTIKKMK